MPTTDTQAYNDWKTQVVTALTQAGYTFADLEKYTPLILAAFVQFGDIKLITETSYGIDLINSSPNKGLRYSTTTQVVAIQVPFTGQTYYNPDGTQPYFGDWINWPAGFWYDFDYTNKVYGYHEQRQANIDAWQSISIRDEYNNLVEQDAYYALTSQYIDHNNPTHPVALIPIVTPPVDNNPPVVTPPDNSGDQAALTQKIQDEIANEIKTATPGSAFAFLQAEANAQQLALKQSNDDLALHLQRLEELFPTFGANNSSAVNEAVQNQINDILAQVHSVQTDSAVNLQRLNELLSQGPNSFTPEGLASLQTTIANLTTQLQTQSDGVKTAIQEQTNEQTQKFTGLDATIHDGLASIVNLFTGNASEQNPLLKPIIDNFINSLTTGITSWLDPLVNGIGDTLNKENIVIDDFLHGQYSNLDDFYNALKQAGANTDLLVAIQNASTVIFGFISFMRAKLIPLEIVTSQDALAQYTPSALDISSTVTAYFKGTITNDGLHSELALHGMNDARIQALVSARTLLVPMDYVKIGLQRGTLSKSDHDSILHQYSFPQDAIDLMVSLYELLPSPTDITRIADKHIFSNDIDSSYGQYSELPQEYLDAMSKWGISEDWTRKLWASHWSLPGLQDVFSMLHRGIINQHDQDTYFSLTDTLPFFRDKLQKLSYNVVTRVDLRRLYATKVYTKDDVYNTYLKLGYSAEDATSLTQYTVINETISEEKQHTKIRELTEGLIVKGYKEQVLNENEAVLRLGLVGYQPDEAKLILQIETQAQAIKPLQDKTNYYHDKAVSLILTEYSHGVISDTDARTYLAGIGVPTGEIDIELYYAQIERIAYLKQLIIDKVRSAYVSGHVTKNDATNIMLTNGFGMSEVSLLFEELDVLVQLGYKDLTLAEIKSLAKSGIIQPIDVESELTNMKYSPLHIGWLLQEIYPA